MAKKSADQQTMALIAEVRRRKEEIAKLTRPSWRTNCSFSYWADSSDTTNLHVERNVGTLIAIAAFLRDRDRGYEEAAEALEVESAPDFVWGGFTVADWLYDIKTRIDQLQIESKRKKLDTLEKRLDAVISPELRREMELEQIAAELGG